MILNEIEHKVKQEVWKIFKDKALEDYTKKMNKEHFTCNKSWNEDFNDDNKYVNMNAYIVSSNYVQKKIK